MNTLNPLLSMALDLAAIACVIVLATYFVLWFAGVLVQFLSPSEAEQRRKSEAARAKRDMEDMLANADKWMRGARMG